MPKSSWIKFRGFLPCACLIGAIGILPACANRPAPEVACSGSIPIVAANAVEVAPAKPKPVVKKATYRKKARKTRRVARPVAKAPTPAPTPAPAIPLPLEPLRAPAALLPYEPLQ